MAGGFGGLTGTQQAIVDQFNRLSLGDDRKTKIEWYGTTLSNEACLRVPVNDERTARNIVQRLSAMHLVKAAPEIVPHKSAPDYNMNILPYWDIIIPIGTVNTERLNEMETDVRRKQARGFGWGQ